MLETILGLTVRESEASVPQLFPSLVSGLQLLTPLLDVLNDLLNVTTLGDFGFLVPLVNGFLLMLLQEALHPPLPSIAPNHLGVPLPFLLFCSLLRVHEMASPQLLQFGWSWSGRLWVLTECLVDNLFHHLLHHNCGLRFVSSARRASTALWFLLLRFCFCSGSSFWCCCLLSLSPKRSWLWRRFLSIVLCANRSSSILTRWLFKPFLRQIGRNGLNGYLGHG